MNIFDITFNFEDKNISSRVVRAAEGESILDVALQEGIVLHHNCGGVCACTTCMVYLEGGTENVSEMSEKEEDRLDKGDAVTLESRLGCQCAIHGPVVVRVPDQQKYMGE